MTIQIPVGDGWDISASSLGSSQPTKYQMRQYSECARYLKDFVVRRERLRAKLAAKNKCSEPSGALCDKPM
jgi:hypothetical protein